jgi:uncharacterized repeat protein (TIGR03803 family)
MQRLQNLHFYAAILTLSLAAIGISAADAQTYSDIYDFNNSLVGVANPGILAQGRDGNLYGTTTGGGTGGVGGVFKITPTGTFSVIYNFDVTHGANPQSGLTLGTDGNFYGTTYVGGNFNDGTVFKITPGGVLTTLHTFSSTDGANPYAPPIQGTDASYYGTTANGGASNSGTVYKITSSGTFTMLYQFDGTHGSSPLAPLVQATDGSFYGTASAGGNLGNNGTLFKITVAGAFTVLHNFDSNFGYTPQDPLVQGSDGNFYGTTLHGGTTNGGLVFKLSPTKVFSVLHSFDTTTSADGNTPSAGLVQATDGNFYGVTTGGGTQGQGVLYKISSTGSYSVLYNFAAATGYGPETTLRQHTNGKLYGEATFGGANSEGALFAFDVGLTPFISLLPTSGKVGKSVGILGGGFTGTTGVKFGGTSATFSVVSDTYISASVPAGATTGFVTVVTPAATLTSNQKFRVTPAISSFSPLSGAVGTAVTITGTSFTGATQVKFGGVKATTLVVNSDTQVTANVPSGAKTGKITVTTAGGSATSSSSFSVTPTISSFSPSSGKVGTVVTVTGTGLTQTTKVTFGGVAATTFTVNSDAQVTATVPTGALTGKIAITTPGGTATSATSFTVTP